MSSMGQMGVNGSQQQGNFGGVVPGYMGGSDAQINMGTNKIGGVRGTVQRANQNLNQQNGFSPFDYQQLLESKDPYVPEMKFGVPINPGMPRNNGQIRGKTFNTGNGYNRLSPITIGQMQQESNAGNFQNLPDWMNGIYQNYTPWLSQDTMASNMRNAPKNATSNLYKAERDAGVGFGGLNNDIFRQGLGYDGAAKHSGGSMRVNTDFGVNSEIPTRITQLQRYLSAQENAMAANGRPIVPGQQPVAELQRGLFS